MPISSRNLFRKKGTQIYTEFKLRIGYLFLTLGFSFFSSWIYGKEILYLYLSPLLNISQNIIFTSISEAFTTTFTVCLFFCLCSLFPHFLYFIFCFFSPSLFPLEKTLLWRNLGVIFLGFFSGLVGCYFIIIPELCNWFLNYGTSTDFLPLSLEAKISSYVSWSLKTYFFIFYILFFPIGFWLLWFKKGFQRREDFSKNRKYFYSCILLFCATISPPDLYMQSLFFGFSVTVFEFILWYGFLQESFFRKKEKKQTLGEKAKKSGKL